VRQRAKAIFHEDLQVSPKPAARQWATAKGLPEDQMRNTPKRIKGGGSTTLDDAPWTLGPMAKWTSD
jgi:hypothetical protein